MTYSLGNGMWQVRWRDADGRRQSRRFRNEQAAIDFNELVRKNARVERCSVSSRNSGAHSRERRRQAP